MVTAGILPFRENSHSRAGNRTWDLMISRQRLWPLDHEAGPVRVCMLYWLVIIIMVRFVARSDKHMQPLTSVLLKTLARNLSIMTVACYGIHKLWDIFSSIKYETENIRVISVVITYELILGSRSHFTQLESCHRKTYFLKLPHFYV